MIDPVKLIVALVGIPFLIFCAAGDDYYAGKALAILTLIVVGSVWFIIKSYRKMRSKDWSRSKRLRAATAKAFIWWLK